MDAALSEARPRAITEFKGSKEFQQHLATQGEEAMVTMLSKLRDEI